MEWSFTTSPKPIQMEKNTRITMRQYTTPEQTAKLIELGFEAPKNERWVLDVANESTPSIQNVVKRQDYSIGELIEMLPQVIEFGENDLLYPLRVRPTVGGGWAISYCNEYDVRTNELIDALYDMVIKLKERGVI